jgi:hypothetical protein
MGFRGQHARQNLSRGVVPGGASVPRDPRKTPLCGLLESLYERVKELMDTRCSLCPAEKGR